MSETTFILTAIIITLVIYMNRQTLIEVYLRKIGGFTVFRATYPDGRVADYFAFFDSDRNRLYYELNQSRDKGRPFSAGGAIVSYEVIEGRIYNQQQNSN